MTLVPIGQRFTRIDSRALRFAGAARIGNVYVNRNMIGAVGGVQPFGGEGLSGSGTKAGGIATLLGGWRLNASVGPRVIRLFAIIEDYLAAAKKPDPPDSRKARNHRSFRRMGHWHPGSISRGKDSALKDRPVRPMILHDPIAD